MKIWKIVIRAWFTLASLASFLLGWAVLAHAPKPNQFNPANVSPLPQLAPVPSLEQVMSSSQSQSFFSAQNQNQMVFRSGGS